MGSVLPVSAMTLLAVLVCTVDGGGGPKGGTSDGGSAKLSLGREAFKTLFDLIDGSKSVLLGQALKQGCRGRLWILLFPPIMLEIVAAVLWSWPGCVQVALVCISLLTRP